MAAEVAVSFVLLISAGLLIQSFRRVQAIEPGFDPGNTLAIRLSLPKSEYKDRATVKRFVDLLQSRIQSLPGVEAVGAVNVLPMSNSRHSVDFNLMGRALTPGDAHNAQYRLITPHYFRAMKIPLMQGRSIESRDTAANSGPTRARLAHALILTTTTRAAAVRDRRSCG